MNVVDPVKSNRGARFVSALLYLVVTTWMTIMVASDILHVDQILVAAMVIGFLVIQGILMTWLAGVLYGQHEMQRFRFGIGALMIITTMIALPMAFGSALSRMATRDAPEQNSIAVIFITIHLVISLLPLLVVVEALMSWHTATRNRRQNR